MKLLSQLFAILHAVSGLVLLLFSGWFIAACAIAGNDYAEINFNYLLPAVTIRALALTRIASGYAQMWTGHKALLAKVKTLRITLFAALKDKLLGRRAEGTEALAKHSETIASLNMAWTVYNLGALFMLAVITVAVLLWLPKLLWLWAGFCGLVALVFVYGFLQVRRTGKPLLALKTQFRHDSEHHLNSSSLWHLRPTLSHTDMRPLYEKLLAQHAIGERMLWWTQTIALATLMLLLAATDDYRGQAVLLIFILVLLAAKDWLGPVMRSQKAFADYQESKTLYDSLPLQALDSAEHQPQEAINTLTLENFSVANRPVGAIDCTLHSGDIVLLKGSSGIGKTSLLKAIAGLLPHTGEKMVNGEPLAAGHIRHWHYADQEPTVLSASLADNLRLAQPNASETDCQQALDFADLSYLTNLQQWIGEQGRQLSGGELKRLNVARAYLFDAGLYLFDEPFEGLDEQKQQLLAEAMHALSKRAPVIIASHIIPENLSVTTDIDLS